MIGILNVGFGNIQSIKSAVERLGYDVSELSEINCPFDEITHLILPGVGDFTTASEKFSHSGIDQKLTAFALEEKPILGICLGMQIMTQKGFERGMAEGLNFFDGETTYLTVDQNHTLPHVGWNEVNCIQEHPILEGIKNNVDFYFTHSCAVKNINQKHVYANTRYSQIFPSIIANKNIIGTQFHPEKSLKNGLMLIDNFCQWNGRC